MKSRISTALRNFLTQDPPPESFTIADCLTITTRIGQVIRWTSFDADVTVGDFVFTSLGSRFRRGKIEQKRGLESSTLDILIYPDAENDTGGGQITAAP